METEHKETTKEEKTETHSKEVKPPVEKKVEEKTETKKEDDKEVKDKTKKESTPAVHKVADKTKKEEKKTEETREYIVPLRKSILNVPQYRRAKKAIRTIKEFMVRHMRVEGRNLNNVKIDPYLNEELWFRGIKKPANKIAVKATKKEGIVTVTLAELPTHLKFVKAKRDRETLKASMAKIKAPKKEKEEEKTEEEKLDEKEKEKASVEAGLARQKEAAKDLKHTSKGAHAKKTMPVTKKLK